MKTHSTLHSCTQSLLFSRLCRLDHKARLWAAALFLLFIAAMGNVSGQTVTNCVSVICPPHVVTNYTCDDVFTSAAYPISVTNRCTNVQVQVNCNPPPGTPLPVGPNPIHCEVYANGAIVGACDFTIFVVRDTTPPNIQCPSNIFVLACPGPAGCGAVVNYPPPTASDNSGFVTVTCNPPSGSFFPCTTTTVRCVAEDRCKLTNVCSFTITVSPNGTAPGIQCPPDITVDTCSNNAVVNYPLPVVSPAGTSVICNPPSGSVFPIGTSSVLCTASNACGSSECVFKITVRHAPPPTITCTTSQIVATVPCNSNCVPVFYPAPSVSGGALKNCTPPSGACLPPGTYTVICTATNVCGDGAQCSFDIRVIQGTAGGVPGIQCPGNIVRTVPCGSNCVPVFYNPPVVTGGSFESCVIPSGTCLPVGIYTNVCRATNSCGGSATCQFTINIVPGQTPQIRCPSNIVATVPCGSNCVPVFYSQVVSNAVFAGCSIPSGTCLPVGSYTVICRATNDCGSASCEFTITVNSGQGQTPNIKCPSNIVVSVPCGSNCATVFYPLPTVSNGVLESCNPPSGTCFPVGITTVVCRATNACGQSAICSFDVRVIAGQGQGPSIQCPSNFVVTTCKDNCEVVTYPPPTVSNGGLVGCNPPSGFCFPLGSSPVTCFATNACGSNSCTFVITVRPVPPPTVVCPSNIVVFAPCGSNCVPVFYPATNSATASCTPPSGTCFPVGVNPVTCSATNSCGQSVSCTFTVEVRPSTAGQAPVINCPTNDLFFRLLCNSNCVPITYPLPTVSNGVLVGCTPPPGTCLPIGDYIIHCSATNNCTKSDCSFTVHVIPSDPVPPTIVCPSNIVVTAPCGSNCVVVNYPLPTVNNGVLESCNPPPGTCFPIGLTTVHCRATNSCGLANGCQFDVRVVQSTGAQGPIIRCPTNFTVFLPCNTNCVPVNYPLATVTNGVLVGCNPPPGTCLPVGNHVITCFATNNCGQSACEFVVSVVSQTQPPIINCPSNIVRTLPCGSNCVPVFYPLPGVSGGVLGGCTPPSGTCLPVGIFNVSCYATNSCGLSNKCEFQIRVVQGQGVPPTIICPSNRVVAAPCGAPCVPVSYPAPFVTNGVFTGCTPPSGTCFPIGTNTVVCRATNNCASSICSFTITVVPSTQGQPPSIRCPSNVVIHVPCGTNCVPINYPSPTVTNGFLVDCSPPVGTCLPVGSYVVICTASNACGEAKCEFPLYIVGDQGHPPVFDCPSNIVVQTCRTNCEIVTYPLPTVFNGTLLGCTPAPGTCFPIGNTAVTCVATNSCGSNSCTFVVTVRPVPFPQIICPSNIVVTTCSNGAVVTYPLPTVFGSPAGTAATCTPPSGSFFPIGTTVVRCCITDVCQRTNCCEFTITVKPGNPCVKPPPGMVLWLPFDELVPPVAANIIPGAPWGVHVNGPAPLPGQYVLNSLRFDGLNDYVRVPNYAAIILNNSDLSIDAWVLREVPDQGRRVIVSKLRQAGLAAAIIRGYEYYLNNGVMNLYLAGVAAQNFNSGVAVPADGNWHHVAVTVQRPNNGAVRFYLDGALVNVQAGPIPAPLGNNQALFVGAGTLPAPNSFFHGPIDEVEIFNRALTSAEVFALWNAHQSGKCKITCATPSVTPVQPGTCVTVLVRVCNNTPVPQTISYTAAGAPVTPPQSGTFTLPPFTCTNVPVVLCAPATTPPNSALPWTFTLNSDTQCPTVCNGLVVTHGIIVGNPNDPTGIAGTSRTDTVRISLNGLPPGSPIRLMAMTHDMEPDMQYVSLNGLPPGVPWELPGVAEGDAKSKSAKAGEGLDVPVRFADGDPGGVYTILLEADLDGDGEFEPLSSFLTENSVVSPPVLRIENGQLWWDDQGDGLGTLESADSIDGPWTPVPGGPGTPIDKTGAFKIYRIAVPITE